MLDRTSQIPLIQTIDDGMRFDGLTAPAVVYDDLHVAHVTRDRTPFTVSDLERLARLTAELESEGRFASFRQLESRYQVALINIDPEARWVSDIDEQFRALCATREVLKWFEARHSTGGLYFDTLQVNLMEPGDFSTLHTHQINRQEVDSVLLLEAPLKGGDFCAAHSKKETHESAHHYSLNRGDMVLFHPTAPHGVSPIIEGRRISVVWGMSKSGRE